MDLLSVLVLASQVAADEDPDSRVVGAKNRLVRLGFGSRVPLSYPERMALYALAGWRFGKIDSRAFLDAVRSLSARDPRELVRECWSRCQALWAKILAGRKQQLLDCQEIAHRLSRVLPPELSLMDHQLLAVLLAERADFKFLFEDDMGLGKTVEILAAMALLGEDAFPAVIASPLSVSFKWEKEVLKWLAAFDPVVVELKGTTNWSKIASLKSSGSRLVLRGSWQQLITHQKQLRGLGLSTVVGDESHYMANWESQRTRAFMRVRTDARCILEATGTLMPNGRHREAYAQIKALDPLAFRHLGHPGYTQYGTPRGDWPLFARAYCGPKVQHLGDNKVTKYDGRSNEVDFGEVLARYSIRRTKFEVFGTSGDKGLPPKTRYALPVPVSARDRLRFARSRDDVRARLQDRAHSLQRKLQLEGLSDDLVAERVKRVMSSEAVTQLSAMRLQVGLLKARWCKVRISELVSEGHRVVVFCEHYPVADKAYEVLCKKLGKDQVLLGKGELTGRRRAKLIERGQGGEGSVMILTRAFREGVDLVAYDWLVMMERWWVPGEELQAEDRIHRIGQLKHVGIEYFIVPGTSDESMAELQVWKEQGQQQAAGSAEVRAYEWIMSEAA
jgi:hypothetical protein